jgi:hypothetical protein
MGRVRFGLGARRCGAVLSIAALVALVGCNDLGAPAQTYDMAGDGIFGGDIDGDGDVDLMTGGGDSYGYALNDHTGNFTPAAVEGHYDFSHMVLADVNSDARQDMVNLLYFAGDPGNGVPEAYRLQTLLSNGNGTFGEPKIIASMPLMPGSSGAITIMTADANKDGRADVILYKSAPGAASSAVVYLGTGNNSFSAPITSASSAPVLTAQHLAHTGLEMADMNGDGKLDLIVAGWGSWPGDPDSRGQIAVLNGNGAGGFTSSTGYATPVGASNRAIGPGVGDFNEDGRMDVVVADTREPGGPETLTFWFGVAGGGLGTGVTRTGRGQTDTDLITGDYDGDGNLDVVTVAYEFADESKSSAWLMEGDGVGGIKATVQLAAPTGWNGQHGGLIRRDFDGDGKPDAALSDGRHTVTVFINRLG